MELIKLTKVECDLVYRKLEYRFKKSGNPILIKLSEGKDIELSSDEVELISKKFEWTFKRSGNLILEKFKNGEK